MGKNLMYTVENLKISKKEFLEEAHQANNDTEIYKMFSTLALGNLDMKDELVQTVASQSK